MSEQNTQIIKAERTPLYTVARGIFNVLFRTVVPIKYHNAERLQNLTPPYILIGNHKCMFDPMALAVPVKKKEIRFVGKRELNNNWLVRWAVNQLHMIAIGRGETDMAAMRTCMQTLREGHILGIFPEGTRHQKDLMEEVAGGTALLALRSRLPLVPVYIHGKIGFFRLTHVYVGEPIETADLIAQGINGATMEQLCERIRTTYYAMRDEAQKK